MISKAMIFAAGLGQRMLPLTLHTPKPLLPVGGQPLLFWHLHHLAAAGIQEVVINISHLGEQIRAAVKDGSRWGLEVHFSSETQPLETGGGLLQALPLLGEEAFLLINGDTWYPALPQFTPLEPNQLACLALVHNPPQHPQGDFYLDPASGRIENQFFTAALSVTFSGISLMHPAILQPQHLQAALGQSYYPGEAFALAPLLRYLIKQQQIKGQLYTNHWVDVGTPERLN
ncbi:MAG: nucleotidyltransferase family protein, partial [Marinospirillum sp.]|uniref:N-acetylmuramate alpha-1-phosphate uridylyltransferase MurU n=1 Tax=Marinospirillum sp. TaxID=2183934 RepID=UPI0019FC702A